ncbi:hypothetical protein [Anabaena azotica]
MRTTNYQQIKSDRSIVLQRRSPINENSPTSCLPFKKPPLGATES